MLQGRGGAGGNDDDASAIKHIYDDPFEEGPLDETVAAAVPAAASPPTPAHRDHQLWHPPSAGREADAGGPAAPPAAPDGPVGELSTADWFFDTAPVETVEALLRSDGRLGAFLLRRSARQPHASDAPRLALSFVAREHCAAAAPAPMRLATVHHVSIDGEGDGGWRFAGSHFASTQALLHHLLAQPWMVSPDGTEVCLRYPLGEDDRHPDSPVAVRRSSSPSAPHDLTPPSLAAPASPSRADKDRGGGAGGGAAAGGGSGGGAGRGKQEELRFDGYLTKLGHMRKNWKLRWFELRGSTLSYYKMRGDKAPRGTIDLRHATSLSRADRISNKAAAGTRPLSLKLVVQKGDTPRVWVMYAARGDQIDEWIEKIRQAMTT